MTAEPLEWNPPVSLTADALDLIEAGIEALSRNAPADMEGDTSPENAVTLLDRIRTLRKSLAEVEAYVESHAVPLLNYGKQTVGEFLVEVRGGTNRKDWRHDDVAWALTNDLAAVDGVIDDANAALVGAVRDRIVNAAGIGYWRTTQLKAHGLEPNAYCTTERGRRTIQLTPSVEEA